MASILPPNAEVHDGPPQDSREYYTNNFIPNTFRQGEEWRNYRLPIQKFTMVPRKVAEYYTDFNHVTEDLLENIEEIKDSKTSVLKDVTELLFRWSFECELL